MASTVTPVTGIPRDLSMIGTSLLYSEISTLTVTCSGTIVTFNFVKSLSRTRTAACCSNDLLISFSPVIEAFTKLIDSITLLAPVTSMVDGKHLF